MQVAIGDKRYRACEFHGGTSYSYAEFFNLRPSRAESDEILARQGYQTVTFVADSSADIFVVVQSS